MVETPYPKQPTNAINVNSNEVNDDDDGTNG